MCPASNRRGYIYGNRSDALPRFICLFLAHLIYYFRTYFLSISPSLDVTQIQRVTTQALLPLPRCVGPSTYTGVRRIAGSLTEAEVTKSGELSSGEERRSRKNIYSSTMKRKKCHSGAFPTPAHTRGDPNHGIRDHFFFNCVRSENHRFPRIFENATITYTKYHIYIVNQTCTQA